MNKARLTSAQLEQVPRRAQALMLAGSAVHIAYGIGAMLAPEKMVAARYAPDTHGLADPRLLLRAFGGHLLLSGGLTLAAARSPRHARTATLLCLLTNASDVLSALLELPGRPRGDETIRGGVALSGTGVLAFAAALRVLYR